VITDSVTVHHCETNNGGNIATDKPERIPRYRYAYRNEVYIYRREGLRGATRLMLRTPLHVLRVLLKADGREVGSFADYARRRYLIGHVYTFVVRDVRGFLKEVKMEW
jgi:hypothetical protein